MIMGAKKLAWLIIPLCVGGSLWAQEKIETPPQNTKEAVDKLKAAPSAVGKSLQDLGKTVGAKLGLGHGEVKTAKTTSEAVPVPQAEKEAEGPKPAVSPILSKRDPFRPYTLDNAAPSPLSFGALRARPIEAGRCHLGYQTTERHRGRFSGFGIRRQDRHANRLKRG